MRLGSFYLQMHSLVASLIPTIHDDFRASDDPSDDTPAISLTVGADAEGWSYQTGDNSFTGGAYGYSEWAVVTVARDSDPAEIAEQIIEQLWQYEADEFAAAFPQFKKPQSIELDVLRRLVRGHLHAGYVWAGLTDDGELLCTPCLRAEYRRVFKATRDMSNDGWTITYHVHSGDSDTSEDCAHCNKAIWEHDA